MSDAITAEQIDAYIDSRVDFPEDPDDLAEVIRACTPEQKAKLRRRIGIEMNLADFGALWFKANNRANRPRLTFSPPYGRTRNA